MLIKLTNWYIKHFNFPKRGLKYFLQFIKLINHKQDFIGKSFFDSKFYCNLNDHIEKYIFWYRAYEETESKWLLNTLSTPVTFIDIGANIGYYSILVAGQNGQNNVYAFEPSAKNFERLTNNINLNKLQNIITVNKAIGNKNEAVKLYHTEDNNAGMHTLNAQNNIYETVQQIILDEWVTQQNIGAINYIKMDIEGAEMQALQGMQHILTTQKPTLLIEIANEHLSRFNTNSAAIHAFLQQFGYVAKKINPDKTLTLLTEQEFNLDFEMVVFS